LADLQKTMGVERSIQQYNTSASDDAVRHYVLGAGDDGCREMDHRGNRHPNTMNVHRP